jgi:eukaryotic-like serine/threonine-protein kinase
MRGCPTCHGEYPDDVQFCPRDATRLVIPEAATQTELAAGLTRRYRIVRCLGGGGMGTVFLAAQIKLGNRPVALKILRPQLLDDPEFLLRFQNEAASTARIHHNNVVTIYESGQTEDGSPYIAMEYLAGQSLRQALRSRGVLATVEAAAGFAISFATSRRERLTRLPTLSSLAAFSTPLAGLQPLVAASQLLK